MGDISVQEDTIPRVKPVKLLVVDHFQLSFDDKDKLLAVEFEMR
jgi:hypothetical protein